jgi:hypothetical protein
LNELTAPSPSRSSAEARGSLPHMTGAGSFTIHGILL